MASYKAASTCSEAKSAAEDNWLLFGNRGRIIDTVLWKWIRRGIIEVYKGRKFANKIAVLSGQEEDWLYDTTARALDNQATIILAQLCCTLLGVRRSEHFASMELKPNMTILLCFRNLAGATWDLGDMLKQLAQWYHPGAALLH